MNPIIEKHTDFNTIYNKSCRLAAAVFTISNVIEGNEELETKLKKLALELVSMSVNLKDVGFTDTRKLIRDIEKNSLELISMLDIASLSGLISEMNAKIIKEEFQAFISEMTKFSEKFKDSENGSVKKLFNEPLPRVLIELPSYKNPEVILETRNSKPFVQMHENGNGSKRKDLRKNTILNFVKGHSNASIKDIVPNIIGCSEKTVQRELIELINEGKIKKIGERRWSRYTAV